MIPGTTVQRQPSAWQMVLADAITEPAELLRLLDLDPALLPAARAAAALFPLRVPRGFVARMRKGDPADPLLRQVLPLGAELVATPGFSADPLGESQALKAPGVLHKYRGRALLLATGACGIHCRYCFRRELDYAAAGAGHWRQGLDYLAHDASLSEVILSGGDPLILSNRRLADLLTALAAIPHLRRLRIHSRQPIVLPERIDSGLLRLLGESRFPIVLVLHANHPQEIDAAVAGALHKLIGKATLLNQAVLLKGVNDSAAVLAALSELMFSLGVLPYYLHLLDPVRRAAHFQVETAQAVALVHTLGTRLPGYLVPRLVCEEPGKPGKTLVL
ncbi:MAG: EF-P beta-lysylation protein EpmB [Candidatus Competibacteraceae bacterium]